MHHIVCDGWSLEVLIREVAVLYSALLRREPPALPELPLQYADFAAWQRSWLDGEVLAGQVEFWRGQLAGAYVLGGEIVPYRASRLPLGFAAITASGFVAGISGASGGFIKTPVLTDVMRVPLHKFVVRMRLIRARHLLFEAHDLRHVFGTQRQIEVLEDVTQHRNDVAQRRRLPWGSDFRLDPGL